MKIDILGTGWITPLGRDIEQVWQAIERGEKATTSRLVDGSPWPAWRISPETVADAAAMPRMRRSSVISHFAVAAAKDAAAAAGLDDDALSRCALVFASSDGGVIYTRRFYEDIVKNGPGAGSPLLFPETVYNAPASHVAAALGLSGELLTVVGDAAAGLAAIHLGCELLADTQNETCLVVAAQECDWVSAEAYGRWGLIGNDASPQAAAFSEGAAAVVLGRSPGRSTVAFSHPGLSYSTNKEAANGLQKMLDVIPPDCRPGAIVTGRSGSSFDRIEQDATERIFPEAVRLTPKSSLGEALAVSALQQVIVADRLLQDGDFASVLVPAIGFNGQINALILTRNMG